MPARQFLADSRLLGPFRFIHRGWMVFVRAFSWLAVRVVSILLFVTVFTLYGILMRLLDIDPLNREFDETGSYWEDVEAPIEDIEDFERQY